MSVQRRSLPIALQPYAEQLGLTWQVDCILDNETARASPYILSKPAERVHELIVHDFHCANAERQPFRKAWLLMLATLRLAEMRDPIFSDNKTMDVQQIWELFAVYLMIGVWAYDLLIERLSDETMDGLRSEIVEHHRQIPMAITGPFRPTDKLYVGLGCARLRAVLMRADRTRGTSLTETFQVDWSGLEKVAQPHVELLAVSELFASLPPLAQSRETARAQLELAAQNLMSAVHANINVDIIEHSGRYWWR